MACQDDHVPCVLGQQTVLALTFPESRIGCPLLRLIQSGSYHADGHVFRIPDQVRSVKNMSVGIIGSPHAILTCPVFTLALDRPLNASQDTLPIIWMDK